MSGIAIKIPNADYSSNGLGRVTLKGGIIPITAITINGDDSIVDSSLYSAELTPSNTAQTEVIWSITSGNTYASIDQNGIVTVLEGANNNSVTIKCTSTENNSVYATKVISVTDSRTSLISDGLLRNYDAFESSSTTLNDLTGNGSALSFAGSKLTNTADNNKIFAPATEPYTNAKGQSSSSFLNGLTRFTLEMVVLNDGWVNTGQSDMKDIYHDVSTTEKAGRVTINMASLTGSSSNGYIAIRTTNGAWQICEWSNSTLNIDWSKPHVLDFTAEIKKTQIYMSFYLDGQIFATAEAKLSIRTFFCSDAVFLMSDVTKTQRSLYAVRCYDRVLSATEIGQNYRYNINRYNIGNLR